MDRNHFNTDEVVRKSGSHLTLAERGMIQALHKKGMSLRGIAKNVGCAHTTVYYVNPQERKPQAQRDWPDLLQGRAHNVHKVDVCALSLL